MPAGTVMLRPSFANARNGTVSNELSAASVVIMSLAGSFSASTGPRPGPGTTAVISSQNVSGSVARGGQNDGPSYW